MKSLYQRKEDSLLLIAFAGLKQWGEPTDIENVTAEKARLDRIIGEEYKKSDIDIDYNQFVLNFVKENGRDIVYTDKFVYDIDIPDEYTELNVNTIIDKMTRKANGSKY